RGAAVVAALERDHVLAGAQPLADVEARGRRPAVASPRALPVDPELEVVVARDVERRVARRLRERERSAEQRALAGRPLERVGPRAQDPRRVAGVWGGRGGRGEARDGGEIGATSRSSRAGLPTRRSCPPPRRFSSRGPPTRRAPRSASSSPRARAAA